MPAHEETAGVEKLRALVRRSEVEPQPPDDEDGLSTEGRAYDVESIPSDLEDDRP